MDIECTQKESILFQIIGKAAEKQQVDCYVIGGFVRDKLMGRETNDVDIVCLGDAIELANEVSLSLSPKPAVNFFKNFGTAQIHSKEMKSNGMTLHFMKGKN